MMMKTKYEYIIGIDPDVDGSGVGILYDGREIRKEQLLLPHLVEFLKECVAVSGNSVKVFIEAGWMNKGNYHLVEDRSQKHAAKLGEKVGRNHEVGKQIGVFCDFLNIEYEFVRPLKKIWKGKDGKITQEELQDLMEGSVSVPYTGKTNQEVRDAILIAMYYSGIPLMTKNFFR